MPVVWQISAVQFGKITHISGVILRRNLPDSRDKRNNIRNFANLVRSFFLQTYNHREIVIRYGNKRISTKTDNTGGFSAVVMAEREEEIDIFIPEASEPLRKQQNYPVIFSDTDSPLGIISDIDDTILVSHTVSFFKRLRTVFFVTPHKRKSIDFTYRLLTTVNENGGRVFYVSRSESNLFETLTRFIQNNGLPEGKLFLTRYLNYSRMFKPKKGKIFKEETMRFILDRSPDKKFILLGDDTQRDMEVYTLIAKQYPDQIIRIYIRKTRTHLPGKKMEHWNKLNGLPLPIIYFSDDDDVSEEIDFIKNYK